jgi:hypothetical protein
MKDRAPFLAVLRDGAVASSTTSLAEALLGRAPSRTAQRAGTDPDGLAENLRDPSSAKSNAIEIRIEEIDQLFHSLDPFPFREKDLDAEAEEFIVSWAREMPTNQPLKIVLHLPEKEMAMLDANEIAAAFARYFAYRARGLALDLRELFRLGRRSLAIGLSVLSVAVIASQAIEARFAPLPLAKVAGESLVIFGWVANWRPLEIFFYEWWPIVRRRNLYQRLAAAQVEMRPYKDSRRKR